MGAGRYAGDERLPKLVMGQLVFRLVFFAVSGVAAPFVLERTEATLFVGLALLVWTPWTLLWFFRLRSGRSDLWLLSAGDVLLTNIGLVLFGGSGWILAQAISAPAVAVAALAGGRRAGWGMVALTVATGATASLQVDLSLNTVGVVLLGAVVGSVSVMEIVFATSNELSASAEEAEAAGRRDPTTGLANREGLLRFIEESLATGDQVVVSVYRLTKIDEIAAMFGRDRANELIGRARQQLEAVPGALAAIVDSSTVAIGGRRDADDVGFAARADSAMGAFVAEIATFVELGTVVGWSLGPEDATDAAELLRLAEWAARDADARGERVLRLDNGHSQAVTRRLDLLEAISEPEGSDQLAVHFQPQVDVASGTIVAVEALARWSHPTHGPVRPDEFIGLAEVGGVMPRLTLEVLDRALQAQAGWKAQGLDLAMSINVSIDDLVRPQFPDALHEIWNRHDADPRTIMLEITETRAALPRAIDGTLRQLAAAGVRFAIDDFGTGHSSLLRVRDLPVTELKVDRTFVGSMLASDDDERIVASTLQLGRTLGLEVVAEGVEDEATLERLAEMGCDRIQGYLVSPAVPAEEIPTLCRRWAGGSPSRATPSEVRGR